MYILDSFSFPYLIDNTHGTLMLIYYMKNILNTIIYSKPQSCLSSLWSFLVSFSKKHTK